MRLPDGSAANCDGKKLPTADKDRGKDYNHSTFLDLIIEGLVGLRASLAGLLVLQPLADAAALATFALDNVSAPLPSLLLGWGGGRAKVTRGPGPGPRG